MQLGFAEIAEAIGGQWSNNGKDTADFDADFKITKVSTDTRTLKAGELYLALKGENFDGNLFAKAALEKGACGLVLHRSVAADFSSCNVPVLFVDDGVQALGDLAAYWRNRFSIPVIGLTGSNGKTTTRAILGALLGEHFSVHQTIGNLNNLIGLPQTLLELEAKHQVAVLEMGMNHLGEIERLAAIARPNIGIITNVAGAHLEHLGSIENVARAKGELFLGLAPGGQAIVNADDAFCTSLAEKAGILSSRQISFGWKNNADVMLERRESLGEKGSRVWIADRRVHGSPRIFDLLLPLPGDHNIYNLLAAVTCALHLEVARDELRAGVAKTRPVGSRSRIQALAGDLHVIDDCYNANPTSMLAGLELLKQLAPAGSAVAVLGEMLELGEGRVAAHRELGAKAGSFGFKALFVLGESADEVRQQAVKSGMKESQIHTYYAGKSGKPSDEVIARMYHDLQAYLGAGTWILLKGSRGMALERLGQKISEKNSKG